MATTSPKFSLQLADFLKSLAVAAISQPLLVLLTSFAAGHFNINWTEQWHLAASAGAAYLIKNYFSGPSAGNAAPPVISGKTLIFLFLLGAVSVSSTAQSIFKPLPAMPRRSNVYGRSILLPTDSLPNISNGKFQGLRFAGPDLAFAFPDFSVYTGFGIDWVIAEADPVTGKWTYSFTIGPRIYGGANLGEPTVRAIGAVGLRATFFKGWLALGAIYNLTTKKPQATIGNPAALIPGLN